MENADAEKLEKKQLKKAYKRSKRSYLPFKILSIVLIVLLVILAPLSVVFTMFDNTMAVYIGGTFWELEDEDEDAVYYTMDFDSAEELEDYGRQICREVESEGAALLMNENDALPLESGAKVSLFSGSSVNIVYGGTGSGNVDAESAHTLKQALEADGVTVNQTLWDFYETGDGSEYARDSGGLYSATSAKVQEVPQSVYTDDVLNSVSEYGDAAIVVLSRVGGEGSDLDYQDLNYLALDTDEKEMMAMIADMKADGEVDRIIVLINSANTLQVDFLKENEYDVDAVLWIGDVGITGIDGVADILTGAVNPSGSLVDTYCYDNYSSPAMANFTPVTYQGVTEEVPSDATTYMVYQEGIYVGYKYYETRYEDVVMGTGNAGDYVYDDEVAFPFGYGLSYTDFELSDVSLTEHAAEGQFEIRVTVTNTGNTDGKKTVQVYSQSPYTDYDVQNGVEKPAAALCGFGKTQSLKPGESETLSITVDKRDLASYDAYGAGTYILDAGTYYLAIGNGAHEAVNNILAAKGCTPGSTDGRMDAEGDAAMVCTWEQAAFDAETYAASLNGTAIVNELSDSDLNLYAGSETDCVYLSRNDWTGTWPAGVEVTLTETMIKDLQTVRYNADDYETVEMPKTDAGNGTTLVELIGKDYDDPLWDDLLDNLSFDEMVSLIGDSFHWTMPVVSVNAPGTRDENGPQGLTVSMFGADITASAFTSEDVMAATFNTELMSEIGRVIGNDCLNAEITFLYGPGNNIHRTPYGGRNFEYYSEDGFLSGKMCASESEALEKKGIHIAMKHFALNDCEQDRIGLGVWLNEQSAREIYLKAFQAPIEVGGNGVMTAYTRWGCVWSGGNKGLIDGILRGEWGCDGLVVTDNVLTEYTNGPDGVLAGVSTFDAMMPYVTNLLPEYKDDPVIVTAMRDAVHHDLYAVANSAAMNGIGSETIVKETEPEVVTGFRIAAIAVGILAVLFIILWIRGVSKMKKREPYQNYKAYKKRMKEKK